MWCVRSAEKREQTLAMPAALTVAAGAALSSPLAAQAAVTPSLKNLINSVIAGTLPGSRVLAQIASVLYLNRAWTASSRVQGLPESGVLQQRSRVTSHLEAVSVQCTMSAPLLALVPGQQLPELLS